MRSTDSLDRLLATMNVTVDKIVDRTLNGTVRQLVPADRTLAVYVQEGPVRLILPKRPPRTCPVDTMMLLPPGLQFGVDCGEGTGRIMAGVVDVRLCTAFGLLDQARSPLIEQVDDGGVIRGAWLAMAAERAAARSQIGSQALVDSLMKSSILLLLRRYMLRPGINLRIVRALVDPRLGSALAAILDNPACGHSVESLATSAGLSRSTFARQFAEQLGFPPMEFVTRTRLHHAASMLRSSRTPIKAVAAQIGFSSRSHFSRAFREIYGVDPKSYRQHSTE